MGINKDLSDLPAGTSPVGKLPEKFPTVAPMVLEQWLSTIDPEGRAKAMPERPWRASFAGRRCDRQLYYGMVDAPPELRPTADQWRLNIGTMVHSVIEHAIDTIPGVQAEVQIPLTRPFGSATVDIIRNLEPIPGETEHADIEVCDVKTINGFGFKKMATTFSGPPEGPKSGHEIQVAAAVVELNARQGRLVYLSLENLSPAMAKHAGNPDLGRFVAEFVIPRDRCDTLVDHEHGRVERLRSAIAHDLLPIRAIDDAEYPTGAVITNPDTGHWVLNRDGQVAESGRTWFCDYCDHREQCKSDGPGNQPEQLL
jgi:hypothetical protein